MRAIVAGTMLHITFCIRSLGLVHMQYTRTANYKLIKSECVKQSMQHPCAWINQKEDSMTLLDGIKFSRSHLKSLNTTSCQPFLHIFVGSHGGAGCGNLRIGWQICVHALLAPEWPLSVRSDSLGRFLILNRGRRGECVRSSRQIVGATFKYSAKVL